MKNRVILLSLVIYITYLLGIEGVPALRGVSLTILRGEFIVILGKSGGGKTSLLNILGTIDKPTKGEVYICGKRITSETTDPEFSFLRLRKIGFVFQTFNLISTMTAAENVSLPMILDGRLDRQQIRSRAHELLSRVGMSGRLDHLPSQLSGGEQQRVTIARAIANRPQVLLLDEPTGDLDTKNTHIILKLLLELNRKEGITLIMVTHDIALKNFAHRVIHMVDGKVFKVETVKEKVRQEMDNELDRKIEQERMEGLRIVKPETEIRDPDTYYDFFRYSEKKQKQKEKINRKKKKKKKNPP